MAFELFEDESVISRSKNGSLTLTTCRVKYRTSNSSKANSVSIMLEKISSIQVLYKSRPIYLIISLLLFIAGAYFILVAGGGRYANDQLTIGVCGVLVGFVFLLVYLFTRKHVLSIDSDGGAAIIVHTSGMKRDALDQFIDQIEGEKNRRYFKANVN